MLCGDCVRHCRNTLQPKRFRWPPDLNSKHETHSAKIKNANKDTDSAISEAARLCHRSQLKHIFADNAGE